MQRATEAIRCTIEVLVHIAHVIVIPLTGGLADRVGRKPVYIAGAAAAMLWPFAFPMFDRGNSAVICAASVQGLVAHSLVTASASSSHALYAPTRSAPSATTRDACARGNSPQPA